MLWRLAACLAHRRASRGGRGPRPVKAERPGGNPLVADYPRERLDTVGVARYNAKPVSKQAFVFPWVCPLFGQGWDSSSWPGSLQNSRGDSTWNQFLASKFEAFASSAAVAPAQATQKQRVRRGYATNPETALLLRRDFVRLRSTKSEAAPSASEGRAVSG